MASENSVEAFFSIPELLVLLAQFLQPQDLSRLARSNRHLHCIFNEQLWNHIPADKASRVISFSDPALLSQRVHLIHSFDLSLADPSTLPCIILAMESSQILQQQRFRRWSCLSAPIGLTKLSLVINKPIVTADPIEPASQTFADQWTMSDAVKLVSLLTQTQFLTHLSVPGDILLPDCESSPLFMLALSSSVPCLQHLTVSLEPEEMFFVPLSVALELLTRALELPDLVELYCDFEVESPKSRSFINNANAEEMAQRKALFMSCLCELLARPEHRTATRLTSLQLPCSFWPLDFLVPLFDTCIRDLKRLSVPWIRDHDDEKTDDFRDVKTVEDFQEILAKSCSATLRHVTVSCTKTERWDHRPQYIETSINTVLRACGTGPGLASFVCAEGLEWQEYSFPFTVVNLYSETLEVIVHQGTMVEDASNAIERMVTRCPNLTALSLPWFEGRVLSEVVSSSSTWACDRLKVLSMSVGDPPHHRHAGDGGDILDIAVKISSIPFTVRSPRISITDFMLDDGEGGGYLGQLANLKKLRHLCLMHDFWSRMGAPEIQFIINEWPLLRKITFRTHNLGYLKTFLQEMFCWRQLKRSRPEIEFGFIEFAADTEVLETAWN
ncbi:hypothetical protein BGZ83_006734 [Gryganskiella cystojenkinii]|nr:hypothetical protein BGZ83_006734 [Gryganskiella cystojenkinii]